MNDMINLMFDPIRIWAEIFSPAVAPKAEAQIIHLSSPRSLRMKRKIIARRRRGY